MAFYTPKKNASPSFRFWGVVAVVSGLVLLGASVFRGELLTGILGALTIAAGATALRHS